MVRFWPHKKKKRVKSIYGGRWEISTKRDEVLASLITLQKVQSERDFPLPKDLVATLKEWVPGIIPIPARK